MSIGTTVYTSNPNGVVMSAFGEIVAVFEAWGNAPHGCNSEPYSHINGWAFVDLAERLTVLLLRSRGYDEELLDMALDGDLPEGWTFGDLDAELDRTRRCHPAPSEPGK